MTEQRAACRPALSVLIPVRPVHHRSPWSAAAYPPRRVLGKFDGPTLADSGSAAPAGESVPQS